MGRLILAFKLFFKVLFDKALAERAAELFGVPASETSPPAPPPVAAPARPASTRSDALTLLSVLQREARLIDFLKEEIGAYDDAQIGAAVRDVHRDAAAALERLFSLRPLLEHSEGSEIAIPANVDAARLRLVGNLGGQTPPRGRLQHPGWQATRAELPQYTGGADSARILAPAEVEIP
jgi:uncharacterized small protein (DUF1192 family)